MSEEFAVWQFFEDEWHEKVASGLTARGVVEFIQRYVQRPAAELGIIRRVIAVDDGDNTVFEWKFGEGVTYAGGPITPGGKPANE